MGRTVVGYHGTLYEHASAMASGEFDDRVRSKARWLGSGLYFFEENIEMAIHYARSRALGTGQAGGVLSADIDLTSCLDLTLASWQEIVRNAHRIVVAEDKRAGIKPISQQSMEVRDEIIRAGYHGEWKNYGRNELDYKVIEKAVSLAYEQKNLKFDMVRGLFLEWGSLYDTSWLYSGAHVAIAVRQPPHNLSNLAATRI